jgi:glycosyltransferase involved in cell wall biosynthesis
MRGCWLDAGQENRMTYFDTALDDLARRRMRQLGGTDIVVGLPAYKNGRTIAGVMTALAEGIRQHFPEARGLLVVSDGGSTDDTLEVASRVALPGGVDRVVGPYLGVTGKGSAIRAVLEAADTLGASACAIVDADVRSITPEWINRLVSPVLSGKADFVTPIYTRDRHEVTINDLIAFPLTRALYGRDLRQPLGGEVAMSPRAVKSLLGRDVWETDVARFGIHVWMTTLAINAGWQLYQAPLGTKTHDYKDPTVGFEPKFLQIVGTLFRLMTIYRRIWPEVANVMAVPVWGDLTHLDPEPVPTTRQTLWEGFKKGVKRYRRNINAILDTEQRELLKELLAAERPVFPVDAWAKIVMDFAVVYNRGEGDPDKVALALLPLYYARKASLLTELEGKPWTAVEEAILAQADAFVECKAHLVDRWDTYLPWQAAVR